MSPQELAHDLPVLCEIDSDENDRQIPGDAVPPERRLAERVSLQNLAGGPQRRIGIEDPSGHALEEMGLVRVDVEVTQLHLGLGPGKRRGPLERRGVSVFVGQLQRVFPGLGSGGREGDPAGFARLHANAVAKRDDRVQYRADGVRQRTAIENRARVPELAASAQEPRAVGLELNAADRRSFDGRHVHEPQPLLLGGPRPARREERFQAWDELGLDEEIRKGGMGFVGGGGGEHDLGVGRQLDLSRTRAEVRDGNLTDLGVVFRGDHDLESRRDGAVPAPDLRAILRVHDLVAVRLHAARLIARGPDLPALDIPEEHVGSPRILRRVLAPARHVPAEPAAVTGSRGGDHHRVPAVGEEVSPRDQIVRRAEATQDGRDEVADVKVAAHLFRAGTRHHDRLRRPLLQQELGRLDHRFGMEATPHHLFQERVGEGDDRHPLVVRHVRAHDGVHPSHGQAAARVVDRLVVAVRADGALFREPLEIACRRGRVHHRSERRRVRGDDVVLGEPAFQAESADAEVRILIGEVEVTGVEGGLGDAPGRPSLLPVIDLARDDQAVRLLEQAPGRDVQHEVRHQVLEHRAGPGNQSRALPHRRQRAGEMEPVGGGSVAPGDRDEAREPRFRSEQIVVARVMPSVGDAISDREELSFLVVEKAKVHFADEPGGRPRERRETAHERRCALARATE